jgi:hypothetical protein
MFLLRPPQFLYFSGTLASSLAPSRSIRSSIVYSLVVSMARIMLLLKTEWFNLALTGNNLFLAAESATSEHLIGRIVPQSGSNLDVIGVLFSNFLQGKNQTLQVQGVSVDPSGQGHPVTWLSTAFKTLTLNVILPGQTFKVRPANLFSCASDCSCYIYH